MGLRACVSIASDAHSLEGHFARIEYQKQTWMGRSSSATAHIISGLAISLPAGARDAYFVDVVGNVSTSHFRPAPAGNIPGTNYPRPATLEISPRYPLMGGWQYDFTIGYSAPLQNFLRIASDRRHILSVPLLLPAKDLAIDEAEIRISLPEGARCVLRTRQSYARSDVQLLPPFPMSTERITYQSYLDTTGRPTIILRKSACSDRHAVDVLVRGRRARSSHALRSRIATPRSACCRSLSRSAPSHWPFFSALVASVASDGPSHRQTARCSARCDRATPPACIEGRVAAAAPSLSLSHMTACSKACSRPHPSIPGQRVSSRRQSLIPLFRPSLPQDRSYRDVVPARATQVVHARVGSLFDSPASRLPLYRQSTFVKISFTHSVSRRRAERPLTRPPQNPSISSSTQHERVDGSSDAPVLGHGPVDRSLCRSARLRPATAAASALDSRSS